MILQSGCMKLKSDVYLLRINKHFKAYCDSIPASRGTELLFHLCYLLWAHKECVSFLSLFFLMITLGAVSHLSFPLKLFWPWTQHCLHATHWNLVKDSLEGHFPWGFFFLFCPSLHCCYSRSNWREIDIISQSASFIHSPWRISHDYLRLHECSMLEVHVLFLSEFISVSIDPF